MHTAPYRGSIRVAAALRRFKKEHASTIPFVNQRTALLDSVTVCKPKDEDAEEWNAPDTEAVIYGQVKGFKIRVGNKFGSVEKVRKQIEYFDGEIAEHREVMADCKARLRDLLGSKADRLCERAMRDNKR